MTQPQDWRQRLSAALDAELSADAAPPTRADAAVGSPDAVPGNRPASVLIAVADELEPFIYFTQRSDTLRHHPGQISFPGGSLEVWDASLQAAALREAREEIGLDPAAVEIIGTLPEYRTVTGFAVSPFIGWVEPGTTVAADGREVARLFGVPLTHALDPDQFVCERVTRAGRTYEVYAIDYDGHHIWGATAGMLYGLVRRLALAEGRVVGRPRPGRAVILR